MCVEFYTLGRGNNNHQESMPSRSKNYYLKRLGFESSNLVYRELANVLPKRSEKIRLIASAMNEIHATLDEILKSILTAQLTTFHRTSDQTTHKALQKKLKVPVQRMNFVHVFRLLAPLLKHYSQLSRNDLKNLDTINKIRNEITHEGFEKVDYKGRNPFHDEDSLAQIIFDCAVLVNRLHAFHKSQPGYMSLERLTSRPGYTLLHKHGATVES